MMHEIYSQIFRNVCIVFMHVCVCVHTETWEGQREGGRNREQDTRGWEMSPISR